MLTRLAIPLTLQILVPLALVWWHGRVQHRTFAAWVAMTLGVIGYVATIAAVGNWEWAPSYTPFVLLLLLSAGVWHRATWIRSLPRRPHSNYEWRELANYGNAAIAGVAFALVAIATRPITTESGGIDVTTLNLYRELVATVIGLAMLVLSIRSARTGRPPGLRLARPPAPALRWFAALRVVASAAGSTRRSSARNRPHPG